MLVVSKQCRRRSRSLVCSAERETRPPVTGSRYLSKGRERQDCGGTSHGEDTAGARCPPPRPLPPRTEPRVPWMPSCRPRAAIQSHPSGSPGLPGAVSLLPRPRRWAFSTCGDRTSCRSGQGHVYRTKPKQRPCTAYWVTVRFSLYRRTDARELSR